MGSKKLTAVLLATVLGISTAPINAWADSYTDVEAVAVTRAIENFCTNYATNLSDISNHIKSSSELQLMLGDGGQEILNSFSPVDVSWLNDVTIGIGTGMKKNNLTQSLDLRVNGTKICTLNYYIDFDSSKIYLNIPELHDGLEQKMDIYLNLPMMKMESFLKDPGKIADDLLNGTYTLTMDGSEIAIIDVADYDTAAIKDGVWNGTYIISGSAYETEDGEETDTLNKMQLIFGSDGMDNKNLSVRCSLVNNGAYLGTLFFTSDMENGIESVDPASLNDVYDFNDPDQAAAYTESINLDAIEAGLTDAGMPEGWLDSIISSFSSLEEDISSEAPEDELIKLEPAA